MVLAILFLFFFWPSCFSGPLPSPSLADSIAEPAYVTVYVEYSDNPDHAEPLTLLIQDGNVYADAEVLAQRLGYRCELTDESLLIYNSSSPSLPFLCASFFLDSTRTELALNQEYAQLVTRYRDKDITSYDAYQYLSDVFQPQPPFYENWTIEVTFNDLGMLSIFEVYDMWTGGAHPYSEEYGQTYDLATGHKWDWRSILLGNTEQIDHILLHCMIKGDPLMDPLIETDTPYPLKGILSTTFFIYKDGLIFCLNVGDSVSLYYIAVPFSDENSFILSASRLEKKLMDEE